MIDVLHQPVLYQEVLDTLAPRAGGLYIDGTLGAGGHADGILAASAPDGRLLGLDADPQAVARAQTRLTHFGNRIDLVQGNFRHLSEFATAHGFTQVNGVLLDLGVSSYQIETPEQGFSFRYDAPLDMRFDPAASPSAADVVNTLDEKALADILYTYGEERKSRRIARAIVAARPITTTAALAEVVSRAAGGRRGNRLHPATRTFQALRIYVNDELKALEEVLPQALDLLVPGGVLIVISFHSLEDRIVKQYLRRESQDCICPPELPTCQCGHKAQLEELHRKGLTPSPAELERNPRSRSARLRAGRKLRSNEVMSNGVMTGLSLNLSLSLSLVPPLRRSPTMLLRSSLTSLWPMQAGATARTARTKPQQALLAIALIAGIVAILCLYLYQTARITVTNYDIGILQSDYARLQRENSNLLATLAYQQSIPQMTQRAREAGFRPADTLRYVAIMPASALPAVANATPGDRRPAVATTAGPGQ